MVPRAALLRFPQALLLILPSSQGNGSALVPASCFLYCMPTTLVPARARPQAGVTRTLGPPHADRKQAKTLAAQASSSSGSSGSAAPACSLPFQGRP